jgi:hypothetical protein
MKELVSFPASHHARPEIHPSKRFPFTPQDNAMNDTNHPCSRRDALRSMSAIAMLPLLESSVFGEAASSVATPATPVPQTIAGCPQGRWYGNNPCVGFHYDLHVVSGDTDIGARCDPKALVEMFKLAGCEYVQTDSKGHPGYTSWFSKTPDASVGPGVV